MLIRTETAPISVVVSTLNRPEMLERCLHALSTGTRRPAEVVVVDQGRPEATEAVLTRSRQAGLAVVHVSQSRRGLAASQNAGFTTAGQATVAVVDDDCVPDERWIETVEAEFRDAAGSLLLTGRVLPRPVEGDRVAAVSTRASTQRREWTSPTTAPWHLGTGGNFAVDRAAFLGVGGNDERLGTGSPGRGGNDLDLFDRLLSAGVTARFEPRLVVAHERSTIEEHRNRRGTYGYGAGAMIGVRLRRGDRRALRMLASWLRLRCAVARERRRDGGIANEARVVVGTIRGIGYGVRVGNRPRRSLT